MAKRVSVIVFALGIVLRSAAPALSARHGIVLPQGTDAEEGEGGQEDQGGEGQSDPEAETDPGAGEEAEEETGPPWTYQMARMSVGLVILLLAGTGLLYYRLVGSRQRSNV